ncbi:SGNH/GDSL hydrolase family protein [uncultured Draconibacterium sp.]|uniref:SGNH/GDSL hydrolase family protein n=1 Tax=uncultured Draconibacterium sp. TaxID=1573823 RepID=UPI0025DB45AC|nr:SGNH/GDSL hydrolase family protein [uncultured Draconibacterium sp.]
MKLFSRRNFIKTTGIAGTTSFLLPASVFDNDKITSREREKGLCFLFQGDSITDGKRGRNNDPNHIMGHGYAFSIASRVGADFPQACFTFYNRGVSGNTVPDLQKRWQNDTIDLKPDVLSLLVGINDVGDIINKHPEARDLAEFEKGYRQLLNSAQTANPDIVLVLGIPFVFPVGAREKNWQLWDEETKNRATIVKKLAKEFNAILVDFNEVFEKAQQSAPINYWIWDGIHPTVFGHELMAREWLKQTARKIKCLKKYT